MGSKRGRVCQSAANTNDSRTAWLVRSRISPSSSLTSRMITILIKVKRATLLAIALFGCGLFLDQAQAAPIQGSIDFGGVVTFDTMSLATATRVTAWNSSFVLQDSGSFSSINPGTSVTMAAPWIFNSGTPAIPQPGPATPHLWQVGNFNFDLLSSTVVSQSSTFLNVTGTGTISGNGFDATPGTWSFTSSDSNGTNQNTFGFQAQTAAVPEAGSSILIGAI
jgi:hypothetical protein